LNDPKARCDRALRFASGDGGANLEDLLRSQLSADVILAFAKIADMSSMPHSIASIL